MNIRYKKIVISSLGLVLAASALSACSFLKAEEFKVDYQALHADLITSDTELKVINEAFDTDKFEEKVDFPVEGFCFYQPRGKQQSLQVFLLDESAMGHQMLIKQEGTVFSLHEIRKFPLPPKAEYCAVNNATDQLFVSEENVGVWAYSARAESEISRSIVDLIKPYGNLSVNSGPLAVLNQQLYVAEKDSHNIHQYEIIDEGIQAVNHYQLSENIKLDAFMVKSNAESVDIGIYLDDESEQYYRVPLNSTKKTADLTNSEGFITTLIADGETEAVSDRGDAADDPAIWVHPTTAEKSRILGTNKKRGLFVYNLQGKELQQLLVGRVNNVDIRQHFTHKGLPTDIAAASQRDNKSIALFSISPLDGEVQAENEIVTGLDDVYGLCMYRGLADKVYVFINDQDGRFEQYEIMDSKAGWQGKRVREFRVDSQPEGCAADDKNQRLFIGEENVALWTLGAEPTAGIKMESVASISKYLQADIEGMDLYQTDTENYLLVSSQGNDSYVLFHAQAPYDYVGRFRIGLNAYDGIDGASETDGLTISSAYLGDKYPQGLVVVQDGRNLFPNANQNFKLLSWKKISKEFLEQVPIKNKVSHP